MIRTLCCVAACSVLYEHIVERLVGPIGQLVNSHGGDPLLTHGAFWVPAVDDTVITRPSRRDKTGQIDLSYQVLARDMSTEGRTAVLNVSMTHLLCFMMRPTEYWTSRCSGALRFFTSGVTGCFLCWMCSSVCCTR